MLSRFEKSIKGYNQALLIDSENPELYSKRGFHYLMLNKRNDACKDWSKSCKLEDLDAYDTIKKFCNN
ncbi:tetratricopeptide repeat protein [Mesonia sp. K4-1]|uniref:tetratricopeptide repeat protein n=1 Tax=Mesonia sp. K4-1 TaxID=2602760 RepID=UPI0011C9CAC4|nr:tetratricopeptide repeat protein [Mesonia sp. K4-1]TXK77282.1 tetratricopeptide repeat protein [Mesonia sp. K4-1]